MFATLLLQTISCQVWLCTTTNANILITVVHLTINIFLPLPVFTCYFHCSIISSHFIIWLLKTHFTTNYYCTYYKRWHGLAAYSPAVIHYHTHFLLTIITHVGGSNGVTTGPMKHRLPFLNNTHPILIPKICFNDRALGSNLLQPKGD